MPVDTMTSFKLFPVHFICQEFKLNIETRENNANRKRPDEEGKSWFCVVEIKSPNMRKDIKQGEIKISRKLGRHRIALTNPRFDPISVRVRVCEGERGGE